MEQPLLVGHIQIPHAACRKDQGVALPRLTTMARGASTSDDQPLDEPMMRSASFSRSSNPNDEPLHRRALRLAAVLGIHLLLLAMLLRLTPRPGPPAASSEPITVSLLPASRTPAAATATKAARRRRATSPASAAKPPAALPPSPAAIWSQVIPLTRRELAAADIARIRSTVPPAEGHADSGAAPGDALAGASGGGPGGQQLYDADWYRKPTNAELATYLPAGAPRAGWGMVACQTVAGYRVEDCREIAQYPAGSGLARAVREASWQFRVLPPRINGRPIIGAWVRIRIEYSERGELHAG